MPDARIGKTARRGAPAAKGTDHSAGQGEDLTIPWIISGPGVRRGHEITGHVTILDTAPTIAQLPRLPSPAEWNGQVVTEALVQ